jgi:NADH:ubiquinone oxidoreductase subunit F (NADH-binding)
VSAPAATLTGAPPGVRRLLAGPDGTESLAEHEARLGPLPPRRHEHGHHLIDVVGRSGLRGRGGSGFPTETKMRAVAAGRGARVVVANGCEGEPASAKDAYLLANRPHLVLDGAVLAAHAVNARDVIITVDRWNVEGLSVMLDALAERERVHRHTGTRIRIVDVPARYVAGEESALVHFLNGGDAKPVFVPPRPFERGVKGRPTLIQNVETLSHLALIGRFGADWYRGVGSESEPGTALVTLGGAVADPGVYETAMGTTVGDLVAAAGGTSSDVGAFLLGGYFGTWIPADAAWDLGLSHGELQRAGAAFGCGIVYALSADVCGLAETARVVRYLAGETAGQCGPCVFGLDAIAGALERIAAGRNVEQSAGLVRRWTKQVAGRGACHMPDGAVRLVTTALDTFADELHRHVARGACATARRRGVLPVPGLNEREDAWR